MIRDPLPAARDAWGHVLAAVPGEHLWSREDLALALAGELAFRLPPGWVHGLPWGLAVARSKGASAALAMGVALRPRAPLAVTPVLRGLAAAVRSGRARRALLCLYAPGPGAASWMQRWRSEFPEVQVWF